MSKGMDNLLIFKSDALILNRQPTKMDRPSMEITYVLNGDGSTKEPCVTWKNLFVVYKMTPLSVTDDMKDFYQAAQDMYNNPDETVFLVATGHDGTRVEIWKATARMASINFGELDYSTSDETEIEIEFVLKEVEYQIV